MPTNNDKGDEQEEHVAIWWVPCDLVGFLQMQGLLCFFIILQLIIWN